MQPTDLRSHNITAILGLIASSPTAPSRAELAHSTGLTKPTVSKLVESLLDAGLITEGDAQRGRGSGRPTIPLLPCPGAIVGIGVTISADQVAVLARDFAGTALFSRSIYSAGLANPEHAAHLAGSLIADAYEALADPTRISGIAISIPGRMSEDRTRVISSPGLGWKNVDFAKLVYRETTTDPRIHPGLPAPLLGNDARLVARSEMITRPGQSFLLVHGETGIGGTVVLNGEILHGNHGWAGEIGHTVVDPTGPPCHCGNNGCLESFASAWALREKAGLHDDVHLDDLANHVPPTLLEEIGYTLGIALSNAIALLDLPTIILSGYFGTHHHTLAPHIQHALTEHCLAATERTLTVDRAHIDDSPALIGATEFALLPALQDPVSFMGRVGV